MSDREEWRPCFGGFYAVSNMGRVRREVGVAGTRAGRLLKPAVDRCGYLKVVLCRNGTTRPMAVHLLVAEAFVGVRPSGMQVNHVNGIKTDARAVNLEYVTASENIRHAFAMGLSVPKKGERNGSAKLTESQVRTIRQLRETTRMSQSAIAAQFGVSQSLVSIILSQHRWRHVA